MNVQPHMERAASPTIVAAPPKWLLLLLVIFFAALLPTLPDLARYHGDERYYTDAAIAMLQTGDYLTPRYAHGTERLNKPLLTYWVLCASFKALGVSLFSSRLPLLIAGCGVVWLTWRLGRTLFGPGYPALLSALVMAANVQTMTIATRSTPDMLLCLFVTASLCGFAELLLRSSDNWKSYALAYVGAGLACATKGLWGILPLIFAFLFWCFLQRPRLPFRRLAPVGWVLIGAAIGLSWFAVAAARHGISSLAVFLQDQTTADAEPVKWFLLSNILDYSWATLRHFLPWTVVALAAWYTCGDAFKGFVRVNRGALWFTLGWYTLVFVILSFGLVQRTRYLLPTYPCIAVAVGAFIAHVAPQARFNSWLRGIAALTLGMGFAAGCTATILGLRLDSRMAVGGAVLAALAAGLLVFTHAADPTRRMMTLGMLVVSIFSIGTLSWRPLGGLNPAPDLARKLSTAPFVGHPIAAIGMPPVIVSQIRLLSGGNLDPREVSHVASSGELPSDVVLLVGENRRAEVAAAGYELTPAGYRLKRVGAREIRKAWRVGRREDPFERNRQDFYIATRR